MTDRSKAIIMFCSRLCIGKDVNPLSPSEWDSLAARMMDIGVAPENLLSFNAQDFIDILGESQESAQRMVRLLDRSASLAFEIADYESRGIHIVTRADETYPKQLKNKLKHVCPPLFYYAGDLSILKRNSIGYVGARNSSIEDLAFTSSTVAKTVTNGYAVVSGGAKGVDTTSSTTAINQGGYAIEYLGQSMLSRMKNSFLLESIQNGQLLLMSSVVPDAPFFAGNLMARNKYIYAQSDGTVIVHSEKNGGTWSGATENLRRGKEWTPAFCWNKAEYDGNQELIKMGCIPIDETWDGNLSIEKETQPDNGENDNQDTGDEQLLIPGFE